MEHVFIINPKSGKKDNTKEIKKYLEENFKDLNYTIYNTTGVGDAIRYVKEKCENKKEALRLYACGGDGTLNEVINGAYGYSDVAVSVYPCGTGNDFVKVFGETNYFNDIANIINGDVKKIDLLDVNGRLTVNMCNLGFDASVAYNMNKFKKWPLIKGKTAYTFGLIYSLIFKMKQKCKIYIDDKLEFDDKFLLTAAGNGVCCGGGYYCLPRASVFDGVIDTVIVKRMSRLKFIRMVNNYKTGEYVNMPKYEKVAKYCKCKSVKLESENDITYCLDGECGRTKSILIKIVSEAINFIIPKQYHII